MAKADLNNNSNSAISSEIIERVTNIGKNALSSLGQYNNNEMVETNYKDSAISNAQPSPTGGISISGQSQGVRA